MKYMRFFAFLASLFGVGCKPASPPEAKGADVMKGLRALMLTTPASEIGIKPSQAFPRIFGVVMDIDMSNGHTATVVSMCDGHASLYTTGTFGIMGGIGHESVRAASMNFVTQAHSHFDTASPTKDFPYPASGHVRFYLLGFDGVHVMGAEISAVEDLADPRSAMWLAGQDVLTELRLTTEKE